MQGHLVGKVSQRLRALIKGDDWGVAREVDIATLGLMERVRDEWQSRQQARVEPPFGLPQLMRSLRRRDASASGEKARPAFERRPQRLPEHRLGRDGKPQPLDDAFFSQRSYAIEELTDFADAVFVEIAYRCLLKRQPDPSGFSGFLRPLREGLRDRVEILRALHVSPEGRGQQIRIRGLRRVAFWRLAGRARFVGPFVRWVHALGTAGRIAQRLQVLEARTEAGYQEHAMTLQSLVGTDLTNMAESIESLEKSQVQVETAVLGLGNRYRRFLLEAEMREAARGSSENGKTARPDDDAMRRVGARLERLEEALRKDRSRLDALSDAIARERADGARETSKTIPTT